MAVAGGKRHIRALGEGCGVGCRGCWNLCGQVGDGSRATGRLVPAKVKGGAFGAP